MDPAGQLIILEICTSCSRQNSTDRLMRLARCPTAAAVGGRRDCATASAAGVPDLSPEPRHGRGTPQTCPGSLPDGLRGRQAPRQQGPQQQLSSVPHAHHEQLDAKRLQVDIRHWPLFF